MHSLENPVVATLRFTYENAPDLYDLTAPMSWCLQQADVKIHSEDLAHAGESITFRTDHGTVRLEHRMTERHVEISILVEGTPLHGDIVARQICYQMSRRLIARLQAVNILWQPSLQVLRPAQFRWGVLHDMPYRSAASSDSRTVPHYGTALN